jgi:hypothetical protein
MTALPKIAKNVTLQFSATLPFFFSRPSCSLFSALCAQLTHFSLSACVTSDWCLLGAVCPGLLIIHGGRAELMESDNPSSRCAMAKTAAHGLWGS